MKLGESGEAFFVEELPEEEHEVGRPRVSGVILKYFLCKSIMCLEAQVTHFSLDNNLIKKKEFF